MQKLLRYIILALLIVNNTNAINPKQTIIDSLCKDLNTKKYGFLFVIENEEFIRTNHFIKSDLESVIECYLSDKNHQTLKDENLVKMIRISWDAKNGEIGKALREANFCLEEAKKQQDEAALSKAYSILAGIYNLAGLQKERNEYSRLYLYLTLKNGDKDSKRLALRDFAWTCYTYAMSSGNKSYLDSAALYQKLLIDKHLKNTDPWEDAEIYKTYMMTLRNLNKNMELIKIGWAAISTVSKFNFGNDQTHNESQHIMLGHYYGYIGFAYTRIGNKDSAKFYLYNNHIFDTKDSEKNTFSRKFKRYITEYHCRELCRMYDKFSMKKDLIELLDDAIFSPQRISAHENWNSFLEFAGPLYFKNKLYEKSSFCFEKTVRFKDSLSKITDTTQISVERTNNLVKINLQKDVAKKQEEFLKAENENAKKRSVLITVSGGIIVLILFLFIYFINKRYKLIKEQKQIIEIQEQETKRQNEVIRIQKNLVEEKHREIKDSINYAQRIQKSLMASKDFLDLNLKDYFLFFEPKDVVSGDFYRAAKLSNHELAVIVADSTGHGVPGAIMSILNISCLKESVKEGCLIPSQILNRTREKVIEILKQDGSSEGGKDGMDCSVISIDFNTLNLNYAAANNPIWVIRSNELIKLDCDKMPVGKHDHDHKSFTQQSFQLQKNDLIYLFTDGYADQFGGPNGKKFKYKQLQDLLLSIANETMKTQYQIIKDTFYAWKGEQEQVDDVTLLGIKV